LARGGRSLPASTANRQAPPNGDRAGCFRSDRNGGRPGGGRLAHSRRISVAPIDEENVRSGSTSAEPSRHLQAEKEDCHSNQRSADPANVRLVSQFVDCPRKRCGWPVIPYSAPARSCATVTPVRSPTVIRRRADCAPLAVAVFCRSGGVMHCVKAPSVGQPARNERAQGPFEIAAELAVDHPP